MSEYPLSNEKSPSTQSPSCKLEKIISSPLSNQSNKKSTSISPSNICPDCGKNCNKPSVLKKHIRKHTDERPYPCKLCNRSFKTKSNLTKHEKSKGHSNLLNSMPNKKNAQRATMMLEAIVGNQVEMDGIEQSSFCGTESDAVSCAHENNSDNEQDTENSGHDDHEISHSQESINYEKEDVSSTIESSMKPSSSTTQDNKCSGLLMIQSSSGSLSVEVQINLDTVRHLQTELNKLTHTTTTTISTTSPTNPTVISPTTTSFSTSPVSSPITTSTCFNNTFSKSEPMSPLIAYRNESELHAAESILHMANQRPSPGITNHSSLLKDDKLFNNSAPMKSIGSPIHQSPYISNVHQSVTTNQNQHHHQHHHHHPTRPTSLSDDPSKRLKFNPSNIPLVRKLAPIPDTLPGLYPLNSSAQFGSHTTFLNSPKPQSPLLQIPNLPLTSITPTTNPTQTICSRPNSPNNNNEEKAYRKKQVKENLLKKMQKKQTPTTESTPSTNTPSLLTTTTAAAATPPTTTILTTVTTTATTLSSTPKVKVSTFVLLPTSTSAPVSTTTTSNTAISSLIQSKNSILNKVISNTTSLHQFNNHITNLRPKTTTNIKSDFPFYNHQTSDFFSPPILKSQISKDSNCSSPNSHEACNTDAAMSDISNEDAISPRLKIDEDASGSERQKSITKKDPENGKNTKNQVKLNETNESLIKRQQEISLNILLSNQNHQEKEPIRKVNYVPIECKKKENYNNCDNILCKRKTDEDDEDEDEEIDVVNFDSDDEQFKKRTNAELTSFEGCMVNKRSRKGSTMMAHKRKYSKEVLIERAKKFKEATEDTPLFNPNINAKDLLQDYPLNLSANRQPTVVIPLTSISNNMSASNANILHSIYQSIPSGTTNITPIDSLATVASSIILPKGNMSPCNDEQDNNPLSVLTNTFPAHMPTVTNNNNGDLAIVATKETATPSSHPIENRSQHHHMLYVVPEEKKQCTVCSQVLELSHYKVHMDRHRFTEKEVPSIDSSLHKPSQGSFQSTNSFHNTIGSSLSGNNSNISNNSSSLHSNTAAVMLPSRSRPRNHKCCVCKVAFRVSGHLRKHYNSKSHLQGLISMGLLSRELNTELEQHHVPLQEIVDQNTGNINPEALRRHISSWMTTGGDDDEDDDDIGGDDDDGVIENDVTTTTYH